MKLFVRPVLLSLLLAIGTANAGVIYSTFGVGQSFQTCCGKTVFGESFAVPFQVSVGASLASIDVALEYLAGTNDFIVNLAADNSGIPGSVLESFHLAGVPSVGAIMTANSILTPALVTGTTYWVEVLPGAADTAGLWMANNQGIRGEAVLYPPLFGPSWRYFSNDAGVGAFDVTGGSSSTPEPSAGLLLLGGCCCVGWRMRSRGRTQWSRVERSPTAPANSAVVRLDNPQQDVRIGEIRGHSARSQ